MLPTVERSVLDATDPLGPGFLAAVSARVEAFLARRTPLLEAMGPELGPVVDLAADLLAGGKRLRPAFVVWGAVAAGGPPADADLAPLLDAAASFDLLHVSALVHDDVMDASDLRRGRPAAHRRFEAVHAEQGWQGDGPAFGRAGAILLGDLLIMWSAELLTGSGLGAHVLERARPLVDAMRTEVTCGQYLDMVLQVRPWHRWLPDVGGRPDLAAALADANRVTELKSARYTVVRPLQAGAAVGAALAGDQDRPDGGRLAAALSAYGSPLGRAFQLRDDLLGVFGDPAVTGKPVGDDLREGKRTVLVAHAYAHADDAGRALLVDLLGDPGLDADGVTRLQDVIVAAGAVGAVEAGIAAAHDDALAALAAAEVTDEGRTALTALADAAVRRSS